MTTTVKRSTLLRSLPVLLALFLAFCAAPAVVSQPAAPSRSGSSSDHHQVQAGHTVAVSVAARPTTQPAPAQDAAQPAADAPRVLHAQLTARVSASRAPPAA